MVPKIASAGRSFKGAAAYYLHDKKAQTSARVAFTEGVNLPGDPRLAVAHMIDTAAHANQLKASNGVKAGRKLQKPVYCYSLAWHPDQAPTKEEQIEAARESLEALGVSDRQALIVAHNDEPHPHVHVIVNRVCPETGTAAKMDYAKLRLSQWAEDYERRHGEILCPERVANNEARRRGEYRKDASPNRRDQAEWKKAQSDKLWQDYRDERNAAKAGRKPQYEALQRQRDERIKARQAEVKAFYRPQWRNLFERQRQELKNYNASAFVRLKHAMKNRTEGRFMTVLRAFHTDDGQRRAFLKEQHSERRELADRQAGTVRDAAREVSKAWRYDRDQLRESHKADDAPRLAHYRELSSKLWEQDNDQTAKPEFQDKKDRRKSQNKTSRDSTDAFKSDKERKRSRPRRASARDILEEQERGQDRGRSRDDDGPSR